MHFMLIKAAPCINWIIGIAQCWKLLNDLTGKLTKLFLVNQVGIRPDTGYIACIDGGKWWGRRELLKFQYLTKCINLYNNNNIFNIRFI